MLLLGLIKDIIEIQIPANLRVSVPFQMPKEINLLKTQFSLISLKVSYMYIAKNLFLLKILLIYFQREGKGGRTRGRETLACNPGLRPNWEPNPQPFSLQASAQCTEPHQPGLQILILGLFRMLLAFSPTFPSHLSNSSLFLWSLAHNSRCTLIIDTSFFYPYPISSSE